MPAYYKTIQSNRYSIFVFIIYFGYNVIAMRGPKKRISKRKILLYSTLLSLIFSGNNFAIAKDVTVSSGTELKSVIQKTTEPTKILFEDNIDITSLNEIKIGTNAIEIDGAGNSLVNEKDSRFTFVDNSSLTLKNMKYIGKNTSINVNNANTTISLENVDISGRTTFAVPNGPVLYLNGCDTTLNNVSVSSSKVEISNNSVSGGVIYIQSAKSKGVITDLIDNQITSAGNVLGGLIYNRRTLTPVGELNLNGDVNKNQITAKVNVSGGILNNEKSSIQSIDWNEVKIIL